MICHPNHSISLPLRLSRPRPHELPFSNIVDHTQISVQRLARHQSRLLPRLMVPLEALSISTSAELDQTARALLPINDRSPVFATYLNRILVLSTKSFEPTLAATLRLPLNNPKLRRPLPTRVTTIHQRLYLVPCHLPRRRAKRRSGKLKSCRASSARRKEKSGNGYSTISLVPLQKTRNWKTKKDERSWRVSRS